MRNTTYDFKQVQCIVGIDIIDGFEEGDDSIAVVYNADDWDLKIGADGESTRVKSNNGSAQVTLKLLQSSRANALLNAYYQADKASNSGKFPFLLKDSNGGQLQAAEEMWVKRAPDITRGAGTNTAQWVLETGSLTSVYAGN